MIICIVSAMLLGSMGYYLSFIYSSASIVYFLVSSTVSSLDYISYLLYVYIYSKYNGDYICNNFTFQICTLRYIILPDTTEDRIARGSKRRNNLLLLIAFIQPVIMLWLTYHVTYGPNTSTLPPTTPNLNKRT